MTPDLYLYRCALACARDPWERQFVIHGWAPDPHGRQQEKRDALIARLERHGVVCSVELEGRRSVLRIHGWAVECPADVS